MERSISFPIDAEIPEIFFVAVFVHFRMVYAVSRNIIRVLHIPFGFRLFHPFKARVVAEVVEFETIALARPSLHEILEELGHIQGLAARHGHGVYPGHEAGEAHGGRFSVIGEEEPPGERVRYGFGGHFPVVRIILFYIFHDFLGVSGLVGVHLGYSPLFLYHVLFKLGPFGGGLSVLHFHVEALDKTRLDARHVPGGEVPFRRTVICGIPEKGFRRGGIGHVGIEREVFRRVYLVLLGEGFQFPGIPLYFFGKFLYGFQFRLAHVPDFHFPGIPLVAVEADDIADDLPFLLNAIQDAFRRIPVLRLLALYRLHKALVPGVSPVLGIDEPGVLVEFIGEVEVSPVKDEIHSSLGSFLALYLANEIQGFAREAAGLVFFIKPFTPYLVDSPHLFGHFLFDAFLFKPFPSDIDVFRGGFPRHLVYPRKLCLGVA